MAGSAGGGATRGVLRARWRRASARGRCPHYAPRQVIPRRLTGRVPLVQALCYHADDRERLLGANEAAYGDTEPFDAAVRVMQVSSLWERGPNKKATARPQVRDLLSASDDGDSSSPSLSGGGSGGRRWTSSIARLTSHPSCAGATTSEKLLTR